MTQTADAASGWSGFICRDAEERAWTLDMHERIRPVSRTAALIVVAAVVAMFPWLNPWSYVAVVLSSVTFAVASALVDRFRRIEPMVLLLPVVVTLSVSATVLNGRELEGDLMLSVFTVIGACGGLPARVVTAYCLYVAVLVSAVTAGLHPAEVAAEPMVMVYPLVSIVSSALIVTGIRRASVDHHQSAVLDVLTGLLNRTGLAHRVAELTHLSTVEPVRVGVVVLDLDHFKAVNDVHGHQRGDEVLTALGHRIRRQLRAFDLAFRVGGEEFVLLVPGGTPDQTRALADRLLDAVRREPLAGLPVTMSAGVATSGPGELFDYDVLFTRADAALYAAKRDGRDRVGVAASA